MTQAEWAKRAQQHYTPNYRPAPVVFTHGEGCHLYDKEGARYLDFAAGIAVCALGHNHPELTRAISEQARKLLHVSNLYLTEPAVELAEALCERSFADQVFFCNSGAEANEAALKMARRYMRLVKGEDRYEIICATQSFHGRTWAAISATGQPKYHEGFAPLVPGFLHVPYNDLSAIEEVIGPKTCAVFIEPIQGEGGVIVPDAGYLKGLRALCDQHGILLIFDEVQTGVGRTGRWFAHQWEGVTPDIMSLAKGLGGGVPIGATLCTKEAGQGFAPGAHATTFGGNPLATRAGLTVLQVLEREGYIEHAEQMGERLGASFEALVQAHPKLLTGHRGRGLLRGLVVADGVDRATIVAQARDKGLLVTNAGSDTLRFSPPLIVGPAHIERACEVMDEVLSAHSA